MENQSLIPNNSKLVATIKTKLASIEQYLMDKTKVEELKKNGESVTYTKQL